MELKVLTFVDSFIDTNTVCAFNLFLMFYINLLIDTL